MDQKMDSWWVPSDRMIREDLPTLMKTLVGRSTSESARNRWITFHQIIQTYLLNVTCFRVSGVALDHPWSSSCIWHLGKWNQQKRHTLQNLHPFPMVLHLIFRQRGFESSAAVIYGLVYSLSSRASLADRGMKGAFSHALYMVNSPSLILWWICYVGIWLYLKSLWRGQQLPSNNQPLVMGSSVASNIFLKSI